VIRAIQVQLEVGLRVSDPGPFSLQVAPCASAPVTVVVARKARRDSSGALKSVRKTEMYVPPGAGFVFSTRSSPGFGMDAPKSYRRACNSESALISQQWAYGAFALVTLLREVTASPITRRPGTGTDVRAGHLPRQGAHFKLTG